MSLDVLPFYRVARPGYKSIHNREVPTCRLNTRRTPPVAALMFPGLSGVGLLDVAHLVTRAGRCAEALPGAELVTARKRITELENELAIHHRRAPTGILADQATCAR